MYVSFWVEHFFNYCLTFLHGLNAVSFLSIPISMFNQFLVNHGQGTTVRVEFGDATATVDPAGANTMSRSFPHTYGQPLAHFLRATAQVPDAQIITEHPPFRYIRFFLKKEFV